MAANKAAAVAAGRAFAQGMVVQLQETGQRMVLRLISGCALLFMAASPTSMPSQMPTRPVTVTRTWLGVRTSVIIVHESLTQSQGHLPQVSSVSQQGGNRA